MKTDSVLYQLLKRLPSALFELIGKDGDLARHYRFDSVELKKSLRIDGLMLPQTDDLPLYVVELQFQRRATFYANIFAKLFTYLHENNPAQDWVVVAAFANRRLEPKELRPYEPLLLSDKVHRVYLDEVALPSDPPLGLGILKLLTVAEPEVKSLAMKVVRKARAHVDSEFGGQVIELVEEFVIRRFAQLTREEVRAMIEIADLRDTRAWKEVFAKGVEEGIEQGIEKGIEKGIEEGRKEGANLKTKELVRKWLDKGMSTKEIATLLEIPLKEVRRLAK